MKRDRVLNLDIDLRDRVTGSSYRIGERAGLLSLSKILNVKVAYTCMGF